MTISINNGMLDTITDDTDDGWDGHITFSIDTNYNGFIDDFIGILPWTDPAPDYLPTLSKNRDALKDIAALWDDLIAESIPYSDNDEDADITISTISNMPSTADGYTHSTLHLPLIPDDADIYLKPAPIVAGDYAWLTAMHEFGHALGLQHPGDYNAGSDPITYAADRDFDEDTVQFSIMSYFQPINYTPGSTWSKGQILTPMIYDILAIQNYYNPDLMTRLGDTTYGFHSTANRAVFSFDDDKYKKVGHAIPVLTIYDAGGDHDKLDVSGFNEDQFIDLSEGSYSNVGGAVANIGIAFRTIIEDATTGSGKDQILGNAANNRLDGGAGDDSLDGKDGNDTLLGGRDNDSLVGGDGFDTLDGGPGNDTLVGGDGNDTLIGCSSSDILVGSGSDVLVGGIGFDTAEYSSIGGETITIRSLLDPSQGVWSVTGLAEAAGDSLSGIEAFRFGEGGDTISVAGDTANVPTNLDGRGGDDIITGGLGADVLNGGAGSDRLNGGLGADVLIGGAGTDSLRPGQGTFAVFGGADVLGVWIESLADDDELVIDRSTELGNYSLAFSNDLGPIGQFSASDGSNARGIARVVYTGGVATDTVQGGLGNNTIFGGGGSDYLEGNIGRDVLRGDDGSDSLHGGDNNDRLFGGAGQDALDGGGGNDTIDTGGGGDYDVRGRAGDDQLIGSDDAEFLYGDGDDDVLYGFGGDDRLYGGDGNDIIEAGAGNDFIDTGLGVDRVDGGLGGYDDLRVYRGGTTLGVSFYLNGKTGSDGSRAVNIETLTYDAGSGKDTVTGWNNADFLYGNGGDDYLSGGAGSDYLSGGDDNDRLAGGAGQDQLYGGNGNDRIETGGGGDTDVRGGAGDDTLIGTAETEYLFGDADNDMIYGYGGNDRLYGGDGKDRLDGGAGAQAMSGDGGNDVYYVDTAADTVFEAAGGGISDSVLARVSYALGIGQEIELLATANTAGTSAINLTGNELANILRGNEGANVLDGGGGTDTLYGYGGNDTYMVDSGADIIVEVAGGGSDTVNAAVSYALGSKAEVETLQTTGTTTTTAIDLTGNGFANTLRGNAGANVLNGGAGVDAMYGYGGDDTYFVDNAADTVIEARGAGTDTIVASVSYALQAGFEIDRLQTSNAAGTSALALSGNALAQTITGNAGANVIDGKGGTDMLNGGAGRDRFVFDTALNAKTITTIGDFSASDDVIGLSQAIFGGLTQGTLSAGSFYVGSAAHAASDRIVYNIGTGALMYDSNGNGAGGVTQFAQLSAGLTTLSASQFQVTA